MSEVEMINIAEGQVSMTETTPIKTNTTKHSSLTGRYDANQHSINSIENLSDELANIKSPHTIESDKIGTADYYLWDDGNPKSENRVGYFVKCYDNKISICTGSDGEDIFGVTVESAGFIGNQGVEIQRDDTYGLVSTSGFVYVRCENDVNIGDRVIPGVSDGNVMIAKKSDNNYGSQVVAIKYDDLGRRARISLGLSPKQASDLVGDVMGLEAEVSTPNIKQGTVAGWSVTENAFEKTFGSDADTYKVSLNSNGGQYVFGVEETSGDNSSYTFRVQTNGDVNANKATIEEANITTATISDATIASATIEEVHITNAIIDDMSLEKATIKEGSVGGWAVGANGLTAGVDSNKSYAISGVWEWLSDVTAEMPSVDIKEKVSFIANKKEFTSMACSVNDGRISVDYMNDYTGDSVLKVVNEGYIDSDKTKYESFDFGTPLQYVSMEFVMLLQEHAIPVGDTQIIPQQSTTYSINFNSDIDDGDAKVLDIKKDGSSSFYVRLDGEMYSSKISGSINNWETYDRGIRSYYKDSEQGKYRATINDTADPEKGCVIHIGKETGGEYSDLFYVRPNGYAGINKGHIGHWYVDESEDGLLAYYNNKAHRALISSKTIDDVEKSCVINVGSRIEEGKYDDTFYVRPNGYVGINKGHVGHWNMKDNGNGFKSDEYRDDANRQQYSVEFNSRANAEDGTVLLISKFGASDDVDKQFYIRPNGNMKVQDIDGVNISAQSMSCRGNTNRAFDSANTALQIGNTARITISGADNQTDAFALQYMVDNDDNDLNYLALVPGEKLDGNSETISRVALGTTDRPITMAYIETLHVCDENSDMWKVKVDSDGYLKIEKVS